MLIVTLSLTKKNFYDQEIDSDIKRYAGIRKTSRQKELDENPKSIQQIEFVGQLKELYADNNAIDAGNCDKFMFVLTILGKMKEARIKCSQGSVAIF